MKALSLWQPWASAIACGAKRIETRSWSTKYRGPLLIHAGRSTAYLPRLRKRGAITRRYELKEIGKDVITLADLPDPYHFSQREREMDYPLGAIIAVAELVACLPTDAFRVGNSYDDISFTEQERALGDFSPGRYGWVLSNVRELPEPIPYRGKQRLFNVPEEVLGGSGV